MHPAQQQTLSRHFSPTPKTEGIKYIGSKLKLLPHIISLLDGLPVKSVLDGFSGTTRVSQALAQLGYEVVSNDIAQWSSVFSDCYLKNFHHRSYYAELISHLNNVPGRDGWFTENYGGYDWNGSAVQEDGSKKPWQIKNTRKLDGVREEIETLNLSAHDKNVALTALILAMDKVDNTLGHFSSYLKQWAKRSYQDALLRAPRLFINQRENSVLKQDIFDVIKNVEVDLAYFDPPYGSSNAKMPPSRVRYASYYHLWTSIVKNDCPSIFGAAGRRRDTADSVAASVFEEFRRDGTGYLSIKAIERLLMNVNAKYVILSYSSGGEEMSQELEAILDRAGRTLKALSVDYQKNVMSGMRWTNEWVRNAAELNREFLFLIEK